MITNQCPGHPTPAEILEENKRRLALACAGSSPLKGDPADPRRFRFERPGHPTPVMWLPLEMKEPLAGFRGGNDEFDRLRSLFDFPFWAARCVRIKMKGGGGEAPFILNRPQRKLVGALEEMRRNSLPIRLILLKARQWGGSTCVQIYMAWLQLVHSVGLNSLIIAHQGLASDEILGMFRRMMEHYPDFMLADDEGDVPKGRRLVPAGLSRGSFRVPARNCKIRLGTAERPDSCRGGDYNLLHCSEVALWPNSPRKTPEQLMQSATAGILLAPLTMIVLESTANGTGNFFHAEYEAAKAGESQFRHLFIAWYEINQYSRPLDSGQEERLARELLENRFAQQPLSDRRQPGAYLWWLWQKGATLQAIAWYAAERAKYRDHAQMAAEYPTDDIEAFAHSGSRVFDKYRVEQLRPGCRTPQWRGELDADASFGLDALRNIRFSPSSQGALAVWEMPAVAEPATHFLDRYLVAVDIGGRSHKADWSVIAVFDRWGMDSGRKPRIVAQWRGHTDMDTLAWYAARVAAFYHEALLVIESNTIETRDPARDADPDQSLFIFSQLRDEYPNLYARRQSDEDVLQGQPRKYGFHTNTATKPMVVSTLVQAVREGLYVERDPTCLDEFLTYEQRPNGSYGAIPGRHDDLLMTRAIGLHICFREMPMPRLSLTAPPRPGADRRSAAYF